MPANSRSKQLTPKGAGKIKAKQSADIKAAGKFALEISPNTRSRLLNGEPVSIKTVHKAFACFDLILEPDDWQPPKEDDPEENDTKVNDTGASMSVEPPVKLPPSGVPVPTPQESPLTSVANFPMSRCMEKITQAEQVCFLSTWLVLREGLAQLMVGNAAERVGKTRILILAPDSPHVVCRGMDLIASKLAAMKNPDEIQLAIERAGAKVRAEIETSLEDISDMAPPPQSGPSLEVRVYDSTPTMTLLIADDYVCQGFHWRDHQGSSQPHIEYAREGDTLLYQAVIEHFNAIWNSRTTYPYDIAARKIVGKPQPGEA